jgi:glycosyltransferase involved in cell wall biosynthesis
MSSVKFSVVIPTRERAETLRHALSTCLNQKFDDYEIIVSDNHSSPPTRGVVEGLANEKVRYIRTSEPLAMSSNWDFAVAQASGEYIVLIGDDDALLPHALSTLDRVTNETSAKVVRWDPAYYTWPNFALADQANYLRVPLGRGLREVSALESIRAVIEFRAVYTTLPMFYNAAIHRSIISTLRQRTGRVFPHPLPDVYSGFAVAAVAGRYLSTNVPMSVAGQSGASNGIAVLFNRGRSGIDREFRDLNAREGLRSDPRIPDLPVFPHVPVADAFVSAKQIFFPDTAINLDRQKFIRGCLDNLRVHTQGEWDEALRLLRESLSDEPQLQSWFDIEFAHTPFRKLPPPRLQANQLGYDGEYLHLNAANFGVAHVADAAELCEQLLNGSQEGARFAGPLLQEMRRVLDERQTIIEMLKNECAARLELIEKLDARLRAIQRGGPFKRLARWVKQRLNRFAFGIRTQIQHSRRR